MTEATTSLVNSMREARLRLHLSTVPSAIGLSALLGVVTTVALWGKKPDVLLLLWDGALALALAFRFWVARWHRSSNALEDTESDRNAKSLLRYRLSFFLHGLVWGAASLVLQDAAAITQFSIFTIAMVAIAAGALNSTTFDVKAGLTFVFASLSPMLVMAFVADDRATTIRGLIVLTFMVATLISARRAERIFEEAERLRLSEAARAEEARQHASDAEQGRIQIALQFQQLSEADVSLKTYELVANSITDLVSVIGEDQVYRMVNDAWCDTLALRREDVINRKLMDVLSRAISTEERRSAVQRCIDEQRVQVVRSLLDFPGRPGRHIETSYYPYIETVDVAKVRCVVMVSRDVTDQELTRQQLVETAQYLQRTLNATGDAIFASEAENPHDRVRFVNEQMFDMWGIPRNKREELTPGDIVAYATPLFLEPEAENQRIAGIVAANAHDESRVRLKDGRVLLRRCIPALIGKSTLRVWSFRDITKLEMALSAIKSSEAGYRALMDAFPGFITQVDENLVYVYANRRVAERLGTTRERMIGHSVREVVGEETECWLLPHVARLLAGEQVTYERHHKGDDGTVAYDQVTLIKGEDWRTGGAAIYAFGIDISERKKAEQELAAASLQLKRRSDELQLTLESIDQGIVSFDADGLVGIHNTRALSMLGLPPDIFSTLKTYDEVLNYQVSKGEFGKDASFVDAYGQRHLIANGRANSPAKYVRKVTSGALIEVRNRHLVGGGLVRTYADVTDYMNAQREARESEAELRDLLGSFPGYIVAIDKDFHYVYANEKIASFLGTTPQDMLGRHARDVVGEDRFQAITKEVAIARSGQRSVRLSRYPATATRAALDMEVTHVAGRLKTNGDQIIYVFGIDVTARKIAEEAIIAARDAAESASRAKSDFLSHMSHELRTPMHAILGFGQLLELDHQSEADRQDWGREVVKGGRHLLALINEVLDLARVESGKMPVNLEPLTVQPILDDCLMMVRPQASARNISLFCHTIPEDLAALADPIRLKQIVLNLLSNAIKYNAMAGQVSITSEPYPPDPMGQIQISVRDTGSGLSSDQIARLFQPFERLDASVERIEGSGIGLVLIKQLVELMNGKVGVESVKEQGSTFWITLPRAIRS